MPWFLFYALKQLFPTRKYISFFSLISIIGVSLGVSVLIIVQSVMNGFGQNIRQHLAQTYGDINLSSETNWIEDWTELKDALVDRLEIEGIELEAIHPYIESMVMLQSEEQSAFPLLRGIQTHKQAGTELSEERLLFIQNFLVAGNYDALDETHLFLGEPLANQLNVELGDRVLVYSPKLLEYLGDSEWVFPTEFTVAGLLRTGSPSADKNLVIASIEATQTLLELGSLISGLNLDFVNEDIRSLERAKDTLKQWTLEENPSILVHTWMDKNADLLFVLEQEKNVISFIIIFIILVASFSIAVALMLSVLRKTREIGVLCALGAQSWQIALSFCMQGLFIGIMGNVIGIAFALFALENREWLFGLYTELVNREVQFLGVYDLYAIPVHYLSKDFIQVCLVSVLISFSAALVPALRAAQLKPAEALRNE